MTTGVQGFPGVPGSKCKVRKNPLQLKLFGEFQKASVYTRYPKPRFQKACVLHSIPSESSKKPVCLRGILSQSFKKHVFYMVS